MNTKYRLTPFLLMLFLLNACQQTDSKQADNPVELTVPKTADTYPAPNNEISNGYSDSNDEIIFEREPYPADTSVNAVDNLDPYPVATIESVIDGIPFSLSEPISVSDLNITGTAPGNLALAIIDVTYAGTVLGIGRSDDNGEFSIPVQELIEGHRIGLALAEVPAGKTYNEAVEEFYPYRGDGYQNVPNIGVFFDTTLVAP